MDRPQYLARADGRRIAYHKMPGRAPCVVFLGGFKSDMTGEKASHLAAWAAERGQAFVRFDYRGHGQSDGAFESGTISEWRDDAIAIVDRVAEGPLVLVGSSMGGWLMVLVAVARPARVAGLVGIAAAADFTEDLVWARMTEAQHATLARDGRITEPSIYSDEPDVYTSTLIEDGRTNLVLRAPIAIAAPTRLLHGTADVTVPWQQSERLLVQLASADVTLTLVKDADHRLSSPSNLAQLSAAVASLCDSSAASPTR